MLTTPGVAKVNIGCGDWNFGHDWYHIDADNTCRPHVKSDDIFLHNLPDNSLDEIYSSHFIAYMDEDSVMNVLDSWRNKLKKNGVLKIATPDFKAIAHCYIIENFPLSSLIGPLLGQMNAGDVHENIHHEVIYDLRTLSRLLHECEFDNIQQISTGFYPEFKDQSWAYLPDRNYTQGTLISLNLIATK